ncbi:50S ribosomal protein L29 [Gammaproteobacteria bacterium]|nr:50S ribosomal protein L29 [Gammaproteobacteria bacterium]
MSKLDNLKDKSVAELEVMVQDLKKQRFELRMNRSTGQEVKTDAFRKLRRQVARAKTFIKQKTAGSE